MGVTALLYSTLGTLRQYVPQASVTVLDYGTGIRKGHLETDHGTIEFHRCGGKQTRRVWQAESWKRIRLSSHIGWPPNPTSAAFRNATAVLDVSGGDSFTDLYGPRRLASILSPKFLSLRLHKPLILLPQTYGPFKSQRAIDAAKRVVCGCRMAWARDTRSFDTLREVAGVEFDPARHRCGVDVAFGLKAVKPESPLPECVNRWLTDPDYPVIGLNISGLIYNGVATAAVQYGLKANYQSVMIQFIEKVLKGSESRVLLVPHVITPPGHYESDIQACQAVVEHFRKENQRVCAPTALLDPRHVKWLIGQLDWFCGTRMHATIAALSSGVPAAAIAYSDKTLGVFETCGRGEHVADPRRLDEPAIVEILWHSFSQREGGRNDLRQRLPAVLRQAEDQMNTILSVFGERDPAGGDDGLHLLNTGGPRSS